MSSTAYWISPNNNVINVEISHIKSVIDNPEKYGIDKQIILKTYKKYGEKIGWEGKAREKIMVDLINKGWVRCRYFNRDGEWHVQVNKITKRVLNQIWDWITDIITSGKKELYANKNTPVHIISITDDKTISSSVGGIAKGELTENKKRKMKKLSDMV